MIESDDLQTISVFTDWDLPLIDQLKDLALIYHDGGWFEGNWERLEAFAAEVLSQFGDDHAPSRELRQRYDRAVVERKKYDFADEGENSGDEVYEAQKGLVEELLEYHADPEMYIIVHASDEEHGDEAWFLCFLTDVGALGIDKRIRA